MLTFSVTVLAPIQMVIAQDPRGVLIKANQIYRVSLLAYQRSLQTHKTQESITNSTNKDTLILLLFLRIVTSVITSVLPVITVTMNKLLQ